RLRDALLAIDRPALPRRWGEAGISGDLRLSKCLESHSHQRTEANSGPMPWTSSNIGGGADTLACSALSSASRSSSTALICSRSNSSRSSSRQTWALRCWQATAIASLKRIQPRPPIATQRLIPGCALSEEQSFDPVDVLDPFHDQDLSLTANPAAVFIFRRRRPNHWADP